MADDDEVEWVSADIKPAKKLWNGIRIQNPAVAVVTTTAKAVLAAPKEVKQGLIHSLDLAECYEFFSNNLLFETYALPFVLAGDARWHAACRLSPLTMRSMKETVVRYSRLALYEHVFAGEHAINHCAIRCLPAPSTIPMNLLAAYKMARREAVITPRDLMTDASVPFPVACLPALTVSPGFLCFMRLLIRLDGLSTLHEHMADRTRATGTHHRLAPKWEGKGRRVFEFSSAHEFVCVPHRHVMKLAYVGAST